MVIARARVLLNPGSREIVSFARTQVLKFSNQCSQEFKGSVAGERKASVMDLLVRTRTEIVVRLIS